MLHQARAVNFLRNPLKVIFYNGWQKMCQPTVTAQIAGCKASLQREKHTVSYKPYVPPSYKDHDYKNMTLKRPMSPHLTVYAMTIPAGTSIWQRITGVIVTGYALLISAGALFLPNGIESYVTMIQSLSLSSPIVFVIKIVVGLPFTYHYFNGIRFCMWNALRLSFSKGDLNASAFKTIIGTVGLAVVFALL